MITYIDSPDNISPDQLQGFFVGWFYSPTPETHLKLLKNSDYVLLAIDENTNNVIGFITAISDGVLSAYIPLLEVLPDYQGHGTGRELVRRMLEKLSGFYMIDLTCDPERQSFYAQLDMQPSTGMRVRNYERQSGE
jgi:ribosomal protein S18 acetylase RimI-like enzyme